MRSVLLVEDEEAVRTVVFKHLKRWGYEVIAAKDGAEALELCTKNANAFDLLITDVVLPGPKGWAVADHFRGLNANAPVIYMTGYTDMLDLEKLEPDGRAVVLQKPFTMAALSDLMRVLLDERAASRG